MNSFFSLNCITPLKAILPGSHIHIIGICGVAMAPLAVHLLESGFTISGSDKEFYDPMGAFLKSHKINLTEGFAAQNIPSNTALVIIGNSIRSTNEEVAAIKERKLPYSIFPSVLGDHLKEKEYSIVISGTHGKSSSSAMASHVLSSFTDCSYFFGAASIEANTPLKLSNGPIAITEGDEYDCAFFAKIPKFDLYPSNIFVITSLEYDHADIYPNLLSLRNVFEKKVANLLPKSVLICNSDYPILAEIAAKEKTRGNLQVITYGCNKEADYVVTSREHLYDPYRQKVTISFREDRFSYEINQFGEIYALNSLAVIVASLQCKQGSIGSLVETLKSYQGIKRRQEIVISSESITLIDDFAHHPTAVNTTLKAIREAYPDRHLVAIFEPRSNTSRRRVFQEAYVTAFLKADEVIIGHVVPRESDKGIDLFSSSELVTALSESGKKAYSFPTSSDILTFVRESLREPTLLVVMSNGAFGGLVDSLKSFLAVKA